MSTTVQARTARLPHLCDGCHWTPGLRGVPTILPGHRYLRHVAFPGSEGNDSGRVVVLMECVACAHGIATSNLGVIAVVVTVFRRCRPYGRDVQTGHVCDEEAAA